MDYHNSPTQILGIGRRTQISRLGVISLLYDIGYYLVECRVIIQVLCISKYTEVLRYTQQLCRKITSSYEPPLPRNNHLMSLHPSAPYIFKALYVLGFGPVVDRFVLLLPKRVHWRPGNRRSFQVFFWFRVLFAPDHCPRPPRRQ